MTAMTRIGQAVQAQAQPLFFGFHRYEHGLNHPFRYAKRTIVAVTAIVTTIAPRATTSDSITEISPKRTILQSSVSRLRWRTAYEQQIAQYSPNSTPTNDTHLRSIQQLEQKRFLHFQSNVNTMTRCLSSITTDHFHSHENRYDPEMDDNCSVEDNSVVLESSNEKSEGQNNLEKLVAENKVYPKLYLKYNGGSFRSDSRSGSSSTNATTAEDSYDVTPDTLNSTGNNDTSNSTGYVHPNDISKQQQRQPIKMVYQQQANEQQQHNYFKAEWEKIFSNQAVAITNLPHQKQESQHHVTQTVQKLFQDLNEQQKQHKNYSQQLYYNQERARIVLELDTFLSLNTKRRALIAFYKAVALQQSQYEKIPSVDEILSERFDVHYVAGIKPHLHLDQDRKLQPDVGDEAKKSKRSFNIKGNIKIQEEYLDTEFLPPSTVLRLFEICARNQPMDSYAILLYYQQLEEKEMKKYRSNQAISETSDLKIERHKYTSMYKSLCDSFRHLKLGVHDLREVQMLIRSVVIDMQSNLDTEGKAKCYPLLVSVLLQLRWMRIAEQLIPYLYRYIDENRQKDKNFVVVDGWYEHLLCHSRYYRQNELPYAEILHRVVFELNRRPCPSVVMPVVENLFPYTEVESVKKALQAVFALQKQSNQAPIHHQHDQDQEHLQHPHVEIISNPDIPADHEQGGDFTSSINLDENNQYLMDIATLEAISAAAAHHYDSELNLLVWDFLDLYGCQPTVGIYEDTAVVFAYNSKTYRQCLLVLEELEKIKSPSRALIRSLCWKVSEHKINITFLLRYIKELYNAGHCISVSMINLVLSSLAARGESEDALFILKEEFVKYKLIPDADSYCYVMEALRKRAWNMRKDPNAEVVMDECLGNAEEVLSMIDDVNKRRSSTIINTTQQMVYEYTKLLCQAGLLNTANDVVLDTFRIFGFVNVKTLHEVAMSNCEVDEFEMAREIASLATAPIPGLDDHIKRSVLISKTVKKKKKEIDELSNS